MRLNVADIPGDGIGQEFRLLVPVYESREPDVADVFLKVLKIGEKVLVEGSVKISVLLNCCRCLKDFSYPLDISFKEEYNPAEEISGESEKELAGSELDLSFYSNNEIDVLGLVREQVLLSVPMKPLCGPGCRGICPACGRDLEMGQCECKRDEVDPRLAPLKKFKESIKNRKE